MEKIIFFGTNEFASHSLPILAENFDIELVITKPAKPFGRKQILQPSAVEVEAKKIGLKICEPAAFTQEIIEKIKNTGAKLFIVVDYGKIIPQEVLDMAEIGAINVHPSKLPKYRGASPIQSAILNGEKETAITIMLMDEQMDHGPILAQKKENILPQETYGELYNRLTRECGEFLKSTIIKYLAGEIKPQEQDHSKATFTKILKREDGEIDWNMSAEKIACQIRAFNPWPGSFCFYNNKRIKILSVSSIGKAYYSVQNHTPGQFFKTPQNKLAVSCGQNTTLLINKLQPEGKKPMTGEEFVRGYLA